MRGERLIKAKQLADKRLKLYNRLGCKTPKNERKEGILKKTKVVEYPGCQCGYCTREKLDTRGKRKELKQEVTFKEGLKEIDNL